ncbi:MAG: lysophospholipid acyltransferase family protein [Ignavibacteriales bacterium]|nr:lysophospholipid acyltransferase family protein [Ignavibacteriales bacterium]
MKSKLEYFLLISFQKFFGLIGLQNARKLNSIVAFVFFYLIPIRKKTVFNNLRLAFPNWDESKIKKTAWGNYKSIAVTFIEILLLENLSTYELTNAVNCPNKNLIVNKFNEGKGVILLSAHFGNWEFVALSVAQQIGIPFSVIIKPQSNKFVSDRMNKYRTKWGNKIVPLGMSVRTIYQELKAKNIIAMVADQRGPADGMRVNLFGIQSATYDGPATLAVKTGAPMIYGISIRQPDDTYLLELEEVDMNNLPENEEEKIKEITQRHTSILERIIRQYPEQWFWMHNRWKY